MLKLIINNDFITVGGECDKNTIDIIDEECSYTVPASEWSEKYQSGTWNGKISILRKKNKQFPSGLFCDVKKCLYKNSIPFEVFDARKKPIVSKKSMVDLGTHNFRDYQEKGINLIKSEERGILAFSTGSGKTKMSCGIISELSVYPVIFVVPSVSLLKQTVKEFKQSLKPISEDFHIGTFGGGEFDPAENGVNVCTYQTLLTAYNQKYLTGKNKIVDIEDKTSL